MQVDIDQSPLPALPERPADGHKGTFGTVAVVGGCAAANPMIGAPTLAARAALRAGAGLVRLVMPRMILNQGLMLCPSATGIGLPVRDDGGLIRHETAEVIDSVLDACDAMCVGPGLGDHAAVDGVTDAVLRCVNRDDVPMVVDADALNALAATVDFADELRAPCVFTPHPGEFRRLSEALRLNTDPVSEDARPDAAAALARRLGVIVVLKGARTVVSDGHRAWVCQAAQPVLATAGTGDVLGGLLAALIAAYWTRPLPGLPARGVDLYDLARIGVQAHADAAGRWCAARGSNAGMLASELADELPAVLSMARGG